MYDIQPMRIASSLAHRTLHCVGRGHRDAPMYAHTKHTHHRCRLPMHARILSCSVGHIEGFHATARRPARPFIPTKAPRHTSLLASGPSSARSAALLDSGGRLPCGGASGRRRRRHRGGLLPLENEAKEVGGVAPAGRTELN